MPNFFPTQTKVSPSFTEPELIVTYAQASGAFSALQGGKPRVKIGSDDLYVYINALDMRTDAQASQASSQFLPSATLIGNYHQTATYLIRTRAIWDRHDMAAAARYSIGLPAAQDLAQRAGIYQQMRTGLLYGFSPSKGEGLLNTVGATSVTLPADSYGNTTVTAYDNGEMAMFILQQVVAMKTRMFQSGANIKNKVVIISPQRVFMSMTYSNIVQVVQYQRPGAGTATTGQVIQNVVEEMGDEIEWYYDDTLIGKGANGADAVLMTIPEVEQPDIAGINTNVFADVSQSMKAVNLMYADMAAPIKIPTPTPDGAITEIQELRVSSGWCVRPQGITILNMPYES
ncbi:DUF2184 domain-containing protein [Robbsia andropogonis]|uniref:DUF2184 domain-containing protein n=1 Tax=Robbsia andropogonis TaxID=28092 RepID=UPI002A69BE52|nr:DUF2184 domain-containing protein [Robbsia andropogonis]